MTNLAEKIVNEPASDMDSIPGTFDDDAVIRGLLVEAIRLSGLSREQIALKMSWLLSRNVTSDMLNNFTADSKGTHRFPFSWVRAFCKATSNWRIVEYIADRCGFIPLAKEDESIIRLGELAVQQKNAQDEIQRIARNVIERRSARP